MARSALCLCLLALICATAAADYVEVFIKWDNNIKQTESADKAIREELAKELCKVPVTSVVTLKTVDKSSTLNTESHGYYACIGANTAANGNIISNCNNSKYKAEFKDELEDRTSPDQENEGITCTLKSGPPPTAAKATTGRRMMA